ncbi:BQ2448_7344 [Microbotryum intermedium]|uniref:BQ2448_7344 protein n=1 Tax=Microbotryum intermedium TaxID=269621 RepID=A0A238FQD3_9BASI|nr:BQ2448_7344 [Microbotryum intermedium]
MAQRIQAIFGSNDPQVELINPRIVPQGYQPVASNANYGATNSSAAPLPNHGMQVLPPDPTKIEPKVSRDRKLFPSLSPGPLELHARIHADPPNSFIPTKKVWLASERTFLNWLRVALLLSSFALALFNSAGPTDQVAKWMGFAYAVIAILMLGYAYYMHRLRRQRIIHRYAGHHDELYGPIILVGLVFIAVLTNFILRVNQRETLRDHPTPKNPWINTVELVRSAFVISS